jgi:hypothetical protein
MIDIRRLERSTAILIVLAASTASGQASSSRLPVIASAGIAWQATTATGVLFPGLVAGLATEIPATSRLRVRADATALGFLVGSSAVPSCIPGAVCETKSSAGAVFSASGSLVVQPFRAWPYAIAGVGFYSAPGTTDQGSQTSRGVSAGVGCVLPMRGRRTTVEMRYHRVARDLGLMRGVLPLTIGVQF